MSVVGAAIVALLKQSMSIDAVVDGRYAPVTMPDKMALPNVVYQVIDDTQVYSNSGPTGLFRSTTQLSIYAADYRSVKVIAGKIRAVLDGYTGPATWPFGGMQIQSLMIEDERDAPPPPPPGRTAANAGVQMILNVAYSDVSFLLD